MSHQATDRTVLSERVNALRKDLYSSRSVAAAVVDASERSQRLEQDSAEMQQLLTLIQRDGRRPLQPHVTMNQALTDLLTPTVYERRVFRHAENIAPDVPKLLGRDIVETSQATLERDLLREQLNKAVAAVSAIQHQASRAEASVTRAVQEEMQLRSLTPVAKAPAPSSVSPETDRVLRLYDTTLATALDELVLAAETPMAHLVDANRVSKLCTGVRRAVDERHAFARARRLLEEELSLRQQQAMERETEVANLVVARDGMSHEVALLSAQLSVNGDALQRLNSAEERISELTTASDVTSLALLHSRRDVAEAQANLKLLQTTVGSFCNRLLSDDNTVPTEVTDTLSAVQVMASCDDFVTQHREMKATVDFLRSQKDEAEAVVARFKGDFDDIVRAVLQTESPFYKPDSHMVVATVRECFEKLRVLESDQELLARSEANLQSELIRIQSAREEEQNTFMTKLDEVPRELRATMESLSDENTSLRRQVADLSAEAQKLSAAFRSESLERSSNQQRAAQAEALSHALLRTFCKACTLGVRTSLDASDVYDAYNAFEASSRSEDLKRVVAMAEANSLGEELAKMHEQLQHAKEELAIAAEQAATQKSLFNEKESKMEAQLLVEIDVQRKEGQRLASLLESTQIERNKLLTSFTQVEADLAATRREYDSLMTELNSAKQIRDAEALAAKDANERALADLRRLTLDCTSARNLVQEYQNTIEKALSILSGTVHAETFSNDRPDQSTRLIDELRVLSRTHQEAVRRAHEQEQLSDKITTELNNNNAVLMQRLKDATSTLETYRSMEAQGKAQHARELTRLKSDNDELILRLREYEYRLRNWNEHELLSLRQFRADVQQRLHYMSGILGIEWTATVDTESQAKLQAEIDFAVQALLSERKGHSHQLEAATHEIESLQLQFKTRTDEFADRFSRFEDETRSLNEHIRALEDRLELTRRERDEAITEAHQYEAEAVDVRGHDTELRNALVLERDKATQLQQHIQMLKDQLVSDHEREARETRALEQSLAHREKQFEDLQVELNKVIERALQESDRFTYQSAEHQMLVKSLELELSSNRTTITELRDTAHAQSGQLALLQSELHVVQTRNGEQAGEIGSLNRECAALKGSVTEAQRAEEVIRGLSAKVVRLEEQIREIAREFDAAVESATPDDNAVWFDRLLHQAHALASGEQLLRDQSAALLSDLHRSTQEVADRDATIERLKADISRMSSERDGLLRSQRELTESAADLRQRLQLAEQSALALVAANEVKHAAAIEDLQIAHQRALGELRQSHLQSVKTDQEQSTAIAAAAERTTELEALLKTRDAEIRRITEAGQVAKLERAELEALLDANERELTAARSQCYDALADVEARTVQLRSEGELAGQTLEATRHTLTTERDAMQQERDAAVLRADEAQQRVLDMEALLDENETKLRTLERQRADDAQAMEQGKALLELRITELQSQSSEMETLLNVNEQKLTALANARGSYELERKDHASATDDLRKRLSHTEADLEEKERQFVSRLSELEAKLAAGEKARAEQQSLLQQSQARVVDLESSLRHTEQRLGDHAVEESAATSRAADLENRLLASDQVNLTLKAERETLFARVTELETICDASEKRCSDLQVAKDASITELEHALDETERRYNEVAIQYEQASGRVAALEVTLQSSQKGAAVLQAAHDEREREHALLREHQATATAAHADQAALTQQLQAREAHLTAQMDELRTTLSARDSATSQQLLDMQQAHAAVTADWLRKVGELEAIVASQASVIADRDARLIQLMKEREEVAERVTQLEAVTAHVKPAINSVSVGQELAEAKARIRELETAIETMERAQSEDDKEIAERALAAAAAGDQIAASLETEAQDKARNSLAESSKQIGSSISELEAVLLSVDNMRKVDVEHTSKLAACAKLLREIHASGITAGDANLSQEIGKLFPSLL